MQSDFVFHDGAYLRKEVLVTMAKNAGSYLLAEHYISSLLVHAILYKLPDIIDDVNEIREHYHVPPYPDLKAALASSTEKMFPETIKGIDMVSFKLAIFSKSGAPIYPCLLVLA